MAAGSLCSQGPRDRRAAPRPPGLGRPHCQRHQEASGVPPSGRTREPPRLWGRWQSLSLPHRHLLELSPVPSSRKGPRRPCHPPCASPGDTARSNARCHYGRRGRDDLHTVWPQAEAVSPLSPSLSPQVRAGRPSTPEPTARGLPLSPAMFSATVTSRRSTRCPHLCVPASARSLCPSLLEALTAGTRPPVRPSEGTVVLGPL